MCSARLQVDARAVAVGLTRRAAFGAAPLRADGSGRAGVVAAAAVGRIRCQRGAHAGAVDLGDGARARSGDAGLATCAHDAAHAAVVAVRSQVDAGARARCEPW